MREIKFRAWDKELGMWKPDYLALDAPCSNERAMPAFDVDYEPPIEREDNIIMQYTGLKDKNGKEVFEGDILGLEGEIFAPVTFSDGAFQMIAGGSNQGRSPIIQDRTKRLEVMGNIYENPELLEGK